MTKPVSVCYNDGTTESISYNFTAPIQINRNSFRNKQPTKLSKGTGTDCNITKVSKRIIDKLWQTNIIVQC